MSTLSPLALGAAITAPFGVFEILLLVTFAAHLLVMNVALGGALLALVAPGPGRGTAGVLAKKLPTAVAVTVNLGVAPLLFASVLYGQFLYTAAILSAVTWVSFSLVVMLAYALLYRFQPRALAPGAAWLAALAAGLLLSASAVMTNVATLSLRPEAWQAVGIPHGTLVNWADPTFFPRWLHFVLASLAVAGLFTSLVSRRAAGRGDAAAQTRMRFGLRVFIGMTLVQIAVGGLFLWTLPPAVRGVFLGGDVAATSVLGLGLVLAAVALWQAWRGAVGRAAAYAVATVCFMVTVRELARRAELAPQFTPQTLPVVFQVGPFVLFLASAVVVAGGIAWIVIVYRRAAERG